MSTARELIESIKSLAHYHYKVLGIDDQSEDEIANVVDKALTALDAEQQEKEKYKRALLSIKKRSHIKERCDGDYECDCAWGIACRIIAPEQWKELLEQEQKAIKALSESKGRGEGNVDIDM